MFQVKPREPFECDPGLTDWELFRKHCLDEDYNLEGDLWCDVSGHVLQKGCSPGCTLLVGMCLGTIKFSLFWLKHFLRPTFLKYWNTFAAARQ